VNIEIRLVDMCWMRQKWNDNTESKSLRQPKRRHAATLDSKVAIEPAGSRLLPCRNQNRRPVKTDRKQHRRPFRIETITLDGEKFKSIALAKQTANSLHISPYDLEDLSSPLYVGFGFEANLRSLHFVSS